MSLNPNTRLGPYVIIAPLGAGGMGERGLSCEGLAAGSRGGDQGAV
jgi:hypothetical protein